MVRMEDLEPDVKSLIISYLSNQASESEKLALLEWLKKSDEHRKLFLEYRKLFDLTLYVNDNHKFSDRKHNNWKLLIDKIDSFSGESGDKKTKRLPYYLKIAAAVLFIFFAGAATFHWISKSTTVQNFGKIEYQVKAPKGGKSELVLADGTKVWLNAGTSLRYSADYGIVSRVVYLDGEGYFSVVKNPKKPFIVQTSGLKIKAYGTSFNVKAYPEEKFITTTLVEGNVKIEGLGLNLSLKPKEVVVVKKVKSTYTNTTNNGTNSTKDINKKCTAGDEANHTNDSVKVASNVNTKIYTCWKDNFWIIDSEPLRNIAVILERKFNVSIVIKSPELNQYTFTGTFNNETLEQILNIIKLTAPLNYEINKGVVVITEEQKRKATYSNFFK